MDDRSRRKAAKSTRTKVAKKAGKKRAGAGKRAAKRKISKKVADIAKLPAKPDSGLKPATVTPGPVVLASSLGIKVISELKDRLAAAHDTAAPLVIDASGVEAIDTSALQLLVAFANSARGKSRTIEWKAPSAVFREMADLLDLTRHLGIGAGAVTEEDDALCPVF